MDWLAARALTRSPTEEVDETDEDVAPDEEVGLILVVDGDVLEDFVVETTLLDVAFKEEVDAGVVEIVEVVMLLDTELNVELLDGELSVGLDVIALVVLDGTEEGLLDVLDVLVATLDVVLVRMLEVELEAELIVEAGVVLDVTLETVVPDEVDDGFVDVLGPTVEDDLVLLATELDAEDAGALEEVLGVVEEGLVVVLGKLEEVALLLTLDVELLVDMGVLFDVEVGAEDALLVVLDEADVDFELVLDDVEVVLDVVLGVLLESFDVVDVKVDLELEVVEVFDVVDEEEDVVTEAAAFWTLARGAPEEA